MTTTTVLFILVGVSVVSANLMKLILWLDRPRKSRRRYYVR